MRTKEIQKMIDNAFKHEDETGFFAKYIREAGKLSEEQAQAIVDAVRTYIKLVPHFLEQGSAAARGAGIQNEMEQVLAELETYWFKEDDVIPDRFGLGGILDDAYASLVLLQGMSDYVKKTGGRSFLERDLTDVNQGIRKVLGLEAASQLEQMVGVTIGRAMLGRILTQVAGARPFSFGVGPDPMWGNASIDEIVSTRLGAMGVF